MQQKFQLNQFVWIFDGEPKFVRVLGAKLSDKQIVYNLNCVANNLPEYVIFDNILDCVRHNALCVKESYENRIKTLNKQAFEFGIRYISELLKGEINIIPDLYPFMKENNLEMSDFLKSGEITAAKSDIREFLVKFFLLVNAGYLGGISRNLFIYLAAVDCGNFSLDKEYIASIKDFVVHTKSLPIEQQGSLNETNYSKWHEWFIIEFAQYLAAKNTIISQPSLQ